MFFSLSFRYSPAFSCTKPISDSPPPPRSCFCFSARTAFVASPQTASPASPRSCFCFFARIASAAPPWTSSAVLPQTSSVVPPRIASTNSPRTTSTNPPKTDYAAPLLIIVSLLIFFLSYSLVSAFSSTKPISEFPPLSRSCFYCSDANYFCCFVANDFCFSATNCFYCSATDLLMFLHRGIAFLQR